MNLCGEPGTDHGSNMLAEPTKVEEPTNAVCEFMARTIEKRSAISNRHVIVTKGDGIHRGKMNDLDCGEASHHRANNALNVQVSFDDDRLHGAVGRLETDVARFSVEAFECGVRVIQECNDDVSVLW